MNVICIMGRLTADPELRKTQTGKSVVSFTVAVDRNTKEKTTDFLPVVAWNQSAEFICNYFGKGQMIALYGELQSRKYEDKDRNKRTAYEIIVNRANFCGDRKQKTEEPTEDTEEFTQVNIEDDLPF